MWLGSLEALGSVVSVVLLLVLLCSKVADRDHRGLTARETKPSKSGAYAHRASAKIGGNLQGEPIFRLPGPASALACPSIRPGVAEPLMGEQGRANEQPIELTPRPNEKPSVKYFGARTQL